jgi:hypothetical protein
LWGTRQQHVGAVAGRSKPGPSPPAATRGGGLKKSLAAAPGKRAAGAPRRLHSCAPASLSAPSARRCHRSRRQQPSRRLGRSRWPRPCVELALGHGHAWREIGGGYEGGRRRPGRESATVQPRTGLRRDLEFPATSTGRETVCDWRERRRR